VTYGRVRLYSGGMVAMLKQIEVRREIDRLALQVGVEVESSIAPWGMSVDVDSYTTDRAAAAVVITHAGGLAVEGKYGVLTRAAQSLGLRIGKKRRRNK
jgi:hypothetical protein